MALLFHTISNKMICIINNYYMSYLYKQLILQLNYKANYKQLAGKILANKLAWLIVALTNINIFGGA